MGAEAVIVAAARTPFGKLGGGLASVSALDLGARVIREVLERTGTDPATVDQLIMGMVLPAGQGQVPSRQAGLRAGLPATVSSFTVNKVFSPASTASVTVGLSCTGVTGWCYGIANGSPDMRRSATASSRPCWAR